MKRRIHINAIEQSINYLFSERIKQSDLKDTDTCLEAIECSDKVNYVYRKISRRDKAELHRIAQIKLTKYLKEHSDNTFEMFKEVYIEKSKDYQTYYPDYKTNNKQKEIYFDLQTWIEVLENLEQRTKIKGIQRFVGDTDNEKKLVSKYEYSIALFSKIEINPIHHFELLKEHRCEQFNEAKANFISERKLDNVPTTEYDFNFLYLLWLQSELKTIQNWLSPFYPNGTQRNSHTNSEQIEINKYYNYVNSEIEITDRKINPAKRRENFENWIKLMEGEVQINKIDWREVAFKRNTGKAYQHKQDLVACFGNGYIYYEQKFEIYFKEFNIIPYDVFKDLIFDFRQSFPKHGRVEGVNYFDDLIEQLIEKYTPLLKTLPPQQNENIDWINLFESIDIEKPFVPQVHIINTLEQKKNYFSKASFNLTVQYLQNFKKETYFLSDKRKSEYIIGLNIVPPPVVKTESSLNNQTIFEGQSNYFEFLVLYKVFLENSLPPQLSETKTNLTEDEIDNNCCLETIEDWLYPFKDENVLSETDYKKLVSALKQYFETGIFPTIDKQIKVGKVNVKRFGWALNEIFRANKTKNEKLSIEYLRFAKQNISIFTDVILNEADILNSNLYKYFTTKTK